MDIRPAIPADADGIAAAHVAAWRTGYRGVMPADYLDGLAVDRFAANWAEMLVDPAGPAVLVGLLDDEVAGFAVAGPSRDDDAAPGAGELWSVNLDPAHWGRGLGRALTSAAMDALRDRGHARATLWVVAGNDRAQRTYRHLGWTPDGTEKTDTIGGADVAEIRLQVRLEPAPLSWAHPTEVDHADVLAAVHTWWGEDGGGAARAALLPRLFLQHFGPTSFVVRDEGGDLVAFLVGFLSQSRPDEAYVHFLGVAPSVRGRGLGRRLYERFFAAARAAGRDTVRAITSVGNTGSQNFHRHLGFMVSDPVPDYDGRGSDRVTVVRFLSS